jgi:hypothetical protein
MEASAMPRWILASAAVILAVPLAGPAQPPSPPPLTVACEVTCPACVIAPRKETVRKPAYAAKDEPFCLRRVTLWTLLSHLCGKDCDEPCCEAPRYRTRLLKWDVTTECEKLKCVVEPPPAPLRPPSH